MLVASKGPAEIIPVHITSHHHHHQDGLEVKLLRRQRERILNFPQDAHGSLLSTPLSSSALSSSFCNHGCHHHLHHISHHHRHQHLHNFHHNALWSAHLSRHPLAVAHHPHVDARHLLDFDLDVDQNKIFLRLGFLTWPGGSPAPVCRTQKRLLSTFFTTPPQAAL